MTKKDDGLEMLLAIERNLIRQINSHKKCNKPKITKKLELHLKRIQQKIDDIYGGKDT